MKSLIRLILLGTALTCCASTQAEQSPDMQLVLSYPNQPKESQCRDYFEIIRHLSREGKTSLKLAHNIYFDGEYYYVVKQRGLGKKFAPPSTSGEIKQQAFAKFTKEEVEKILNK